MKKIALFLLAIILLLPACGKVKSGKKKVNIPKEPITLVYWRLWDDTDVMTEFINEYHAAHPNVNIVIKKIVPEKGETVYDYQSQVIKLIADGKGPDIFQIHNDWLPYQINQIEPMPKALMTVEEYQTQYPAVVAQDFVKGDKIYAVPFYIDTPILYYNTDIFSEKRIRKPPPTWQELVDLVPALTKYGPGDSIIQSAIPLGVADGIPRNADILATLMLQYGAEMDSPDHSKILFDLPAADDPSRFPAAEALEFYTSFANPHKSTYTYTDKRTADGKRVFPSDVQAFMEGKAVMMINYSYLVPSIRKFAPKLHFETAPLPQINPQDPVVLANYWGETVAKTSKYPQVAWDFIKFMVHTGRATRYARFADRVPALKSSASNFEGARFYGAVAEQIPFAKSWYRKNSPQVEEIFAEMIENVLHSNLNPQKAVEIAVQKLKNLNTE